MSEFIAVLATCFALAFAVAAAIVLIVPWFDFYAREFVLNPFYWIDSYFNWCHDKQVRMRGGRE